MPGGFEQLEIYQVAREFRKRVYKPAKPRPAHEQYGSASPTRNAAGA